MKTIYLKQANPLKDTTVFHIKVTPEAALDITDDAINVWKFDDEAEYHKYIASCIEKDVFQYTESTQAEFDAQFIKTVELINSISNQ